MSVIHSHIKLVDHPKLQSYALEFQRYTDIRGASDAVYLATAHLFDCGLWTNDNDMDKQGILSFVKYLKNYDPSNAMSLETELYCKDEQVVQQLKAIMDIIETVNPRHAEGIEGVYACRPGKTDPRLIDMEHTTAPINFETGEIG